MISILIDSREPWPHPWARYFSGGVKLTLDTLETGDLALSSIPDGAVIERKTVTDLLTCIGKGRERFEREVKARALRWPADGCCRGNS
jgi:ERCC4-type nuclease